MHRDNNINFYWQLSRVYLIKILGGKGDKAVSDMPVLFITTCKTSQHKNMQSSLEQTDLVQNGTLPSNLFGRLVMPVELSGQDMYHRVYFTESLAEKRDTYTSTTVKKN